MLTTWHCKLVLLLLLLLHNCLQNIAAAAAAAAADRAPSLDRAVGWHQFGPSMASLHVTKASQSVLPSAIISLHRVFCHFWVVCGISL